MMINRIDYGMFEEIIYLNPSFSEKKNKIRISLYLDPNMSKWNRNIPYVLFSAYELLPDCKDHNCSFNHYSVEDSSHQMKERDINEIPLIIEHIILGVINQVGNIDNANGLTCVSKTNEYLYSIFVECDDPCLGEFAVLAAKNLVEDILIHGDRSPLWDFIINSAKHLYPSSYDQLPAKKLKWEFGWSKDQIEMVIRTLKSLSFFHPQGGIA